MSDPQTQLGKLIEGNPLRDAVHIAVAPVVCGSRSLVAGNRIGFFEDGKVVGLMAKEIVGVVDPFLTSTVFPGQKFWMFLLPNTITSLNHVWTHPAFEDAAPRLDPKATSEAWLRNFCATANCPGYEEVMAVAVGGGAEQWSSEFLHFYGHDAGGEIPPEFWDHVEAVTGRKITRRPSSFSCSY